MAITDLTGRAIGIWLLDETIPLNDKTITVPIDDIRGYFWGITIEGNIGFTKYPLNRVRINKTGTTSSFAFYMQYIISDNEKIQSDFGTNGTWASRYYLNGVSNKSMGGGAESTFRAKIRELTITYLADGHNDFVEWLNNHAIKVGEIPEQPDVPDVPDTPDISEQPTDKNQLVIYLTSKEGVTLNTKGKYCDKNIVIVPQIEGGGTGVPDKITPSIKANLKDIEVNNIVIKLINLERSEE